MKNLLSYLSNGEKITLNDNISALIELLRVLVGFVDSDHEIDIDSRRAINRFIFFLGSCIISLLSKSQISVTLNTMVAKYIAACAVSPKIMWLSKLLQNLEVILPKLSLY